MPTFINTRPISRAADLSSAMQSQGFEVLNLPLLEMVSIPLSKQCISNLQGLIHTSGITNYTVLIIVSPAAVEFAFSTSNISRFASLEALQQALTHITVIAVGQTTAKALAEYGIMATVPKVNSNEGMLNLSTLQLLDCHSRVMIWRGKGGRQLLINTLEKRGVKVDVVEWYARQLPKETRFVFQTWFDSSYASYYHTLYHPCHGKPYRNRMPTNLITKIEPTTKFIKPIKANLQQEKKQRATVLISSGEGFANWQLVIDNFNAAQLKHYIALNDFNYIVLGNRLAQLLKRYALHYHQVDSLSVTAITQEAVFQLPQIIKG